MFFGGGWNTIRLRFIYPDFRRRIRRRTFDGADKALREETSISAVDRRRGSPNGFFLYAFQNTYNIPNYVD